MPWPKSLAGPSYVLLLALLLTSLSAEAAAADELNLTQLMTRLAQRKETSARYVERKHFRLLSAPLETSGTLKFRAPDYLEKRTVKPYPESLILSGDTLTFENPRRKQKRVLSLQSYPIVWALVESIRSTLAGDVGALQRHYRVQLNGSAKQWRLLLQPIDLKMRGLVQAIGISGRNDVIDTIEIQEADGDRSVMSIKEGG